MNGLKLGYGANVHAIIQYNIFDQTNPCTVSSGRTTYDFVKFVVHRVMKTEISEHTLAPASQ